MLKTPDGRYLAHFSSFAEDMVSVSCGMKKDAAVTMG